MIVEVFLLLGGFGALYFGADWMVRGAARLESSLGLSPMVIGLTVVSLGTSAPELVVALLASLQGSSDLAVGNVLGSNLANIGLILGITALVSPLVVAERVVKREIPSMLILTVVLFPLIVDFQIGRADGIVLMILLALYLTYVFRKGTRAATALPTGYPQVAGEVDTPGHKALFLDFGLLIAGGLGLVLGGKAIVEAATFLARALGVTELVIGLSIVAIGTSLPELATSVMAAIRKKTDIAVGNVIGSNIFNIAGVLGVAGTVKPLSVDPGVLWVEFPAVFLISFLVLLIPVFSRGGGDYRVTRWQGALLLGAYLSLGYWVLTS